MTALEMRNPGMADTKTGANTEATGAGFGVSAHETGPDRVNDPSRETRREHSGESQEQRSNLRRNGQAG